ncbi:hypothetical protein LR48_Vigan08g167800 [Vigna angularis]|uniref:Allene oxide synthase n=1 Tax=Phaseolus angularis TaxID=3914 RepID=A0A0L9V708_PHAAN|nr:hypothetical protein LR48_Vigan08g167800 [Vigna angularis]
MATSDTTATKLPLKEIPGSYGLPFFGPMSDRHDYFYHQGRDKFFADRIQKYKATVIRTNMPPGPFISSNPKVIALLDGVSFQILFDNSKVDKRDVLDGTFMPSTSFTGGYRVCAFQDTTEPSHALLKTFYLNLLASKHASFIPLFRKRTSSPGDPPRPTSTPPSAPPPSTSSSVSSPLAPLATLGLPRIFNYAEDFLIRTIPLPAWTVKSSYKKLCEGFASAGSSVLDEAERLGIKRDEACHNLVFMLGFNAQGGLVNQFPILMKWVGLGGESLHRQLAEEIRSVVKEENGVSLRALDRMTLTKSVVYEVMRIEPAVPFQYGKAREDLVVESHDATYVIKKGEMIFGYQPFATKDPKIFERAEEFVAHRFVGPDGEKLLNHVLWSNGRETEEPTPDNKQCPAKNLVVLLCRLYLVEFFLRYDTFTFDFKPVVLGPQVTIKSLVKSSY